jgi:hypothetical protein
MPSMLQFLYHRKISDQSDDVESPDTPREPREGFSVNWVVHRYETLPVATENCLFQDLDQIVETCKARLSEMRGKHPDTPPDGFLVFNGAGTQVRRWFGMPRLPM